MPAAMGTTSLKPPPLRISLTFAMIGLVVVSLCLALAAQRREAGRRERALKDRLVAELRYRYSREHRAGFLGDLGPVILIGATRGERLAVDRDGDVTSIGIAMAEGDVRELAEVLLDFSHYGFTNADDMPEPRHGVRLTRGTDTLDILMDDSPSSSPGEHQDLWVVIRDGDGRIVHRTSMCWSAPRLRKVIVGSSP